MGAVSNVREVLGYLGTYRGQTFVLKIEDSLLSTPLFSLLIRDIVLLQRMGIRIVLIPGAKDSIDQVLRTYSVTTESRENIRITSSEAMPLVKLGASNVANRIISYLAKNGAHGVMGNWVRARAVGVVKGVDYLDTGKVEKVYHSLIENMLGSDMIPIVPNIGWNAVGRPYNISSNQLAIEVASVLSASKLFFVSGVSGVPHQEIENSIYFSLDLSQAESLLELPKETFDFQVREYLRLGLLATKRGVDRAHIIDGSKDGYLLEEIFSSLGSGTMLYANKHMHIQPANSEDIPDILRIMQPYVNAQVMIQRTADEVGERLQNYVVYKVDQTIHGCAALRFLGSTCELEAVVVDKSFAGKGTGKRLISYMVERAQAAGAELVFILTTQSSDFFMRNGFVEGDITMLPQEKKSEYDRRRNSRIFVRKL